MGFYVSRETLVSRKMWYETVFLEQRGEEKERSRMILETKRLCLRPWKESDAEECYRYAKDPRVGPSAGWPVHTSVENSRKIIREILSVPETFAIVWKETGLPIGCISLMNNTALIKNKDERELGYWLGVPYWGQEIMPEAVKEMLRYAFEELKVQKVWCCYYEGNDKSKRVQEKCGFQYQKMIKEIDVLLMGEKRTDYVNCLSREAWMNRI